MEENGYLELNTAEHRLKDLIQKSVVSNMPEIYRQEMVEQFDTDPWIKTQLLAIDNEIDRASNHPNRNFSTVDELWKVLIEKWKKRREIEVFKRNLSD